MDAKGKSRRSPERFLRLTRLEFVDRRIPGFWESRGYDDEGTIQPGLDHPLDLGETRRIQGGEITEY